MTGTTAPLLVLAAPGAGGAAVATAIAGARDRPALVWDEVADDGTDARLRTWCRTALWRRDRDWTCPPPGPVVATAADRPGRGLRDALTGGAVLFDVALPFLLPLLADVVDEVEVVVVVRDPREALPAVLAGTDLPPDHADELLRVAAARLLAIATALDCPVVDRSGDAPIDVGPALGRDDAVRVPADAIVTEPGVEHDDAVEALRDRAGAVTTRVPVAALVAAAAGDAGDDVLDRRVGPVTAQRRSRLHALAGRLGVQDAVLECTRASGAGAWVADERVRVVTTGSLPALQQAVRVPPASAQAVLLTDALSWVAADELRAALALAMEVVAYGGYVLLGRHAVDDATRAASGLSAVSDADVAAVAEELGLVALPAVEDGDLRLLPFSAHTAVAGTIRDLEAEVTRLQDHLARRTTQRDAAVARYDDLRGRRVVQVALRLARWLDAVVRRLRGLVGRG